MPNYNDPNLDLFRVLYGDFLWAQRWKNFNNRVGWLLQPTFSVVIILLFAALPTSPTLYWIASSIVIAGFAHSVTGKLAQTFLTRHENKILDEGFYALGRVMTGRKRFILSGIQEKLNQHDTKGAFLLIEKMSTLAEETAAQTELRRKNWSEYVRVQMGLAAYRTEIAKLGIWRIRVNQAAQGVLWRLRIISDLR